MAGVADAELLMERQARETYDDYNVTVWERTGHVVATSACVHQPCDDRVGRGSSRQPQVTFGFTFAPAR